MQCLGAREVKRCLIDGKHLYQRGKGFQHRSHLTGNGGIFCHVRAQHHGLGAEIESLEHRHGGTHAIDPRDIAAGGDYPAHTSADDHRFVAQFWPVALFHRSIEGVAIDMGDGEAKKFRMTRHAYATAPEAVSSFHRSIAIPAEVGHRSGRGIVDHISGRQTAIDRIGRASDEAGFIGGEE